MERRALVAALGVALAGFLIGIAVLSVTLLSESRAGVVLKVFAGLLTAGSALMGIFVVLTLIVSAVATGRRDE